MGGFSYYQLNERIKDKQTVVGLIYQLYVFFLTLGSIGINFIPSVLRQYIFTSTSTLILYIGILTLFISERGIVRIPLRVKILFYLLAYVVIVNLGMATILFSFIGRQNGETTFTAIIGTTYHWIEAITAIIYNIICLNYYVDQNKVFKLIIRSSVLALIVGVVQQLVYFRVPGFSIVYSTLAPILNLANTNIILERGFSCFGSEPASASRYLFTTFPALFCCIKDNRNDGRKLKYVFFLFMLTALFLTSTSSTVVILMVLFFCTAFILVFCKKRAMKIWLCSIFFFGLFYVLFYTFGHPESLSQFISKENRFWYSLFGKAFDTTNQSTAYRISSVIVNIKIFFSEFFFTGVGSGIQGFFYNSYVPSWSLISAETRALLSGERGISNGGGNFFPVILSSYGLIGGCVFGIFIKKFIGLFKMAKNNSENQLWKMFFLLGIAGFLLDGWFSSSIISNQPLAFLLAIPFVL